MDCGVWWSGKKGGILCCSFFLLWFCFILELCRPLLVAVGEGCCLVVFSEQIVK